MFDINIDEKYHFLQFPLCLRWLTVCFRPSFIALYSLIIEDLQKFSEILSKQVIMKAE